MKPLLVIAAAGLLLVGGCTSGHHDEAPPPPTSGGAGAYPVKVGEVALAKRPERIVSLAPTATEMLFAIGAGPQVTAVDNQSDHPAGAPRTNLSGVKPNAEAIAAKKPDLVVLSRDVDKIAARLTVLKIPVFLTPAATGLDDTYREIGELGTLTGHQAEADALHQRMSADIKKIVASVPPREAPLSYYYELDPAVRTATSATFIGSIFKLFNMINVVDSAAGGGANAGYPRISREAVVKANPSMIFLADTGCCKQSATTVKARAGWGMIDAVRDGRIYALDDDLASRWGPRSVDLVKEVADAVAKANA
jgi:iron complex transport system substrate-binding protein